jgi:hypothetical protein
MKGFILEGGNMSRITAEQVLKEDNIKVRLENVPAVVSTIYPSASLWLTLDEADKLAFQLNSVLQDIERAKEIA